MIEAKVRGIADFREALLSIPPKLRRRALRNALAAGARVVRDAIKPAVPVLALANALKAPYRTPGTVRDAIAVRTSKRDTAAGDVGVFVNVKPAKGAGKNSPIDPFYWRFLNFDHASRSGKIIPGTHFLEKGVDALDQALTVFEQTIGPQIQRLNDSPKDPL